MPVELNIVESVTELDTTVVTVVLESASEPGPAGPGVPAGGTTGQALVKASDTDYDTEWGAGGGGGGAPTDATYLVTTANGDLSAEVVVGATPGGELGGTWASPTVDATHSGSSHAAVQAAAEATAAAALSAHLTDTTDAHDASAISSVAAGNLAATDVQAALNELDTEKAAATHAHAGEDITSGTVADARIASTIARDSEVTSAISAHEADTTSVHGIADTSALALTTDVVTKALYDANTVLAADSDNTPAAVTMAASTILARLAAGNIKAASVSEIRTLLDVPTNAEAILDTLMAAKGDLITATANDTPAILTVGTDGHVLTADSSESAGIKWAAGGAGAVTLICDSLLGSNQNTFDTNTILGGNIPGTYKHLLMFVNARSSRAANNLDFFHLRFNNDSGNNYDTMYTQLSASNVTTGTAGIGDTPATAALALVPAATSASGVAACFEMRVPDYAGTTFHKMLLSEGMGNLDTTDFRWWNARGKWRSTAAVTRITLTMINGNFLTGSRFTLYGLG